MLNLHLRTDSWGTKQKKQKTIIINLRHSRGQWHGVKREKQKLGWICLCKEIGFELLNEWKEVAERTLSGKSFQIFLSKAGAKILSRLVHWSGKVWDLKKHTSLAVSHIVISLKNFICRKPFNNNLKQFNNRLKDFDVKLYSKKHFAVSIWLIVSVFEANLP